MKKPFKIALIVLICLAILAGAGLAGYKLFFEDADILSKETYYRLSYEGKTYDMSRDEFRALSAGQGRSMEYAGESYTLHVRKAEGKLNITVAGKGFTAAADVEYEERERLSGVKPTWLTARDAKTGHYYKLASVTTPTSFSAVKDAEDPDGDELTTQFAFSRKDSGLTTVYVTGLFADKEALEAEGYEKSFISYPDDGSAKAKSKAGDKYEAYVLRGDTTRYLIQSPYETGYICIEVCYVPDVGAKKQESLLESYFTAQARSELEAMDPAEYEALVLDRAALIEQAALDSRTEEAVLGNLIQQLLSGKIKPSTDFRAEAEKAILSERAAELRETASEEALAAVSVQLDDNFIHNQVEIAAYSAAAKINPDRQYQSIVAEFKQNFIDDSRWQQLYKGLLKTLEITALSTVMGVVLGAIVATIRTTWERNRDNMRRGPARSLLMASDKLCGVYLTIIRGTPVMVQLLIMYLIIFASSKNGTTSAVVGFGINSGAYVAEIIRGGIMSIDQGQFEAGRSLGFSYPRTMIYIILPQVFKDILPALANEFIALLKETSVSGYVAVRDLNKGGENIRSVTYSPFMPLIAVALIYLAVVMFFTKLVGILERRLRESEHR